MSAEVLAAPVAHPRKVSTRFFRSELRLIVGRRRNQVGLVVLALVPALIAVVEWLRSSGPGPSGDFFVGQLTNNGLFVGLAALTLELPLFLPLAVAAIAGDSVAGEANLGTLRYLLVVPVHRTRLLAVKYVAIVLSALIATLVVVVVGAVLGLIFFGGHDVSTLSGGTMTFGASLARAAFAAIYVTAGLSALGAIGLFISTLTEQPIAATVAIVILSTGQFIMDSISSLAPIQPWLLTHRWMAFIDLFRSPIDWSNMTTGLWVDAAYAAVFLLAAWARFAAKDITS